MKVQPNHLFVPGYSLVQTSLDASRAVSSHSHSQRCPTHKVYTDQTKSPKSETELCLLLKNCIRRWIKDTIFATPSKEWTLYMVEQLPKSENCVCACMVDYMWRRLLEGPPRKVVRALFASLTLVPPIGNPLVWDKMLFDIWTSSCARGWTSIASLEWSTQGAIRLVNTMGSESQVRFARNERVLQFFLEKDLFDLAQNSSLMDKALSGKEPYFARCVFLFLNTFKDRSYAVSSMSQLAARNGFFWPCDYLVFLFCYSPVAQQQLLYLEAMIGKGPLATDCPPLNICRWVMPKPALRDMRNLRVGSFNGAVTPSLLLLHAKLIATRMPLTDLPSSQSALSLTISKVIRQMQAASTATESEDWHLSASLREERRWIKKRTEEILEELETCGLLFTHLYRSGITLLVTSILVINSLDHQRCICQTPIATRLGIPAKMLTEMQADLLCLAWRSKVIGSLLFRGFFRG